MDWLRDLTRTVSRALPRTRLPGAREPVPEGQPASVEDVIRRLRALDATLPPEDGVACFNRMYLRVTELVAERITLGDFRNEEFMTRLDVVFAALYLDAVDAAQDEVNPSWSPLFEGRGRGLAPIQFALAGMNAHINHDLPVAVVRTCRQLGLRPTSTGVRADYDRVSDILATVHAEVRQSFLDGLVLSVDREVSPLLTLVGSWSVARARDAAWVNTEVLWRLRRQESLDAEFRATLARTVGMATRQLLVPVAAPATA
jgi:hypothetical protein